MWPLLAIGAGLGLLKGEFIDKPKAERQRKLVAETIRYSPWTHLKPDQVREADPLGSALSFGLAGGQLGNSLAAEDYNQKLLDKWNGYGALPAAPFVDYSGQGNPYAFTA